MIWVNDFWTINNIPKWLKHAKTGEDYLGFSDVIFPWFLFVLGMSIPFSFENRIKQGEPIFRDLFDQCSALMKLIVNCPKPVIAEVSGIATAAGCQLVATCDLALASSSSKFATPGVNLGLFCSTPMVALTRAVKNKHAMEMLLTGDFVEAKKAKQIGLINNFFTKDKLRTETMKLAKKIASKSSTAVMTGKSAFYAQAEKDLADAYEYTSKVMVENLLKQDAKEGIGAFIEKRKPVFDK